MTLITFDLASLAFLASFLAVMSTLRRIHVAKPKHIRRLIHAVMANTLRRFWPNDGFINLEYVFIVDLCGGLLETLVTCAG